MGLFNRIRPDPGFVRPVRSNPDFVSPIRSDPIRSGPIQVLSTALSGYFSFKRGNKLFCKGADDKKSEMSESDPSYGVQGFHRISQF